MAVCSFVATDCGSSIYRHPSFKDWRCRQDGFCSARRSPTARGSCRRSCSSAVSESVASPCREQHLGAPRHPGRRAATRGRGDDDRLPLLRDEDRVHGLVGEPTSRLDESDDLCEANVIRDDAGQTSMRRNDRTGLRARLLGVGDRLLRNHGRRTAHPRTRAVFAGVPERSHPTRELSSTRRGKQFPGHAAIVTPSTLDDPFHVALSADLEDVRHPTCRRAADRARRRRRIGVDARIARDRRYRMRLARLSPSLLGIAISIAGISGCKKPAGTPYSYADACNEAHKDKRVIVEGYLAPYTSTRCTGNGCELLLHEKPKDEQGARRLQLTIPVGSGDSEMDNLPQKFSEDDVKVHTKSGVIGLNKRVRVTATISRTFMAKGWSPEKKELVDTLNCEMIEPTIEAL